MGMFTLEQLGNQAQAPSEDNVKAGRELDEDEAQYAEVGDDSTYEMSDIKLVTYNCPHCRAEMITSDTTASTTCVYCNKPVVLGAQVAGDFAPKFVIPFKTEESKAHSEFLSFIKKPLTPKPFLDAVKVNKVKGVYMPFWAFSGLARGGIDAVGTTSQLISDKKYLNKEYRIKRRADVIFNHIPVDAAKEVDSDAMDSIEPFDMSELKPFSPAYLAGFLAERYEKSSEDVHHRFKERIEKTMQNYCVSDVKNMKVTQIINQCRLEQEKAEYIMLPAWLLYCEFSNHKYLFAMNGQTGKFIGNIPIDWGKLLAFMGAASILGNIIGAFLLG
jgi:hypothetical protein